MKGFLFFLRKETKMDLTPDMKKKWMRRVTTLILICILILLGLKNVDTVSKIISWCISLAMPLIIGAAIALIIDVPMCFFESYLWKKAQSRSWCAIRRPLAFVLSLIIIFGCLVGIVWIIIPELIDSLKIIISGTISLINRLNAMTPEELAEIPFGNVINAIDWDKALLTLQNWLKTQSTNILKGAFTTLSSVIVAIFDLIVAFCFAIYVLFSKDKLKRQAVRMVKIWLPKKFGDWLIHACSVACTNFRSFISGQTLEALILGLLCMLGMLVLNIPYAPMVSVLVGITALIPVVGGFIGGGVGAFMILTSDPSKALLFVIFLVILQQLEGNLIYPKVMGHRVHLPGLWILAAVTIGGGIGGPLGMLLSVPITSTVYVLVKEATEKREKELCASGDEAPSEAQDIEADKDEADDKAPHVEQSAEEADAQIASKDEAASPMSEPASTSESKPCPGKKTAGKAKKKK